MKRSHTKLNEEQSITDIDKFKFYSLDSTETWGHTCRGVLYSNHQIEKIRERKNLTVVELGGGLSPQQLNALTDSVRVIEFKPTFFDSTEINLTQFKMLMGALKKNVMWISLPVLVARQIHQDINAILASIPPHITVYSTPNSNEDGQTQLLRMGKGQDPLPESEIQQIIKHKAGSAKEAKRVKQSDLLNDYMFSTTHDGYSYKEYSPQSSNPAPVHQQTAPSYSAHSPSPLQPRPNFPLQQVSFFPSSTAAAQYPRAMPSAPNETLLSDMENKYQHALIELRKARFQQECIAKVLQEREEQLQERDEQLRFYKAKLQERDYQLNQSQMKLSRSQELLTSAHNELGVIKYNVTTKILPKAQKKFEELKELKDKKRELEILAQAKGLGYPPGYSPKFYASNGVKLDKKPDNKNNRYRPSSS